MVLAAEPVPSAAGHHVHGVPHVEQRAVGGVDSPVGAVGEPRLGEGTEHREVAQATVGLLELGLDRLGEVPLALVARGDDMRAAIVRGISPADEATVTPLAAQLRDSTLAALTPSDRVLFRHLMKKRRKYAS